MTLFPDDAKNEDVTKIKGQLLLFKGLYSSDSNPKNMAAALDQARTLFTDDSSSSQDMLAFIDVLIPLASAAGAKQMASLQATLHNPQNWSIMGMIFLVKLKCWTNDGESARQRVGHTILPQKSQNRTLAFSTTMYCYRSKI